MLNGSLRPISVLIVGDFLLDTYTIGSVRRISPEAPVPILEVKTLDYRPGGAGNVVLNLASLGARVFAAGRIGADPDGERLRESLSRENVDLTALLSTSHPKTPVKNRIVANGQQLLRIDSEVVAPLSPSFEESLLSHIDSLLPQIDIIALSDYGKGIATPTLTPRLITLAHNKKIPIIIDPKGRDFTKYRNATVIKPNLKEAYDAANLLPDQPLELVAERLLPFGFEHLLITRSEEGMTLFNHKCQRSDFPVRQREVKDVTGAGDTVLAVLSIALGNGLDIGAAIHLANCAAGLVIERFGCAQVTLKELELIV